MTRKQAREAKPIDIRGTLTRRKIVKQVYSRLPRCMNSYSPKVVGQKSCSLDTMCNLCQDSVEKLLSYTEQKKPSNVYSISGNKLTPLRESDELQVFYVDGQVHSVLTGDIEEYTEQKILEAQTELARWFVEELWSDDRKPDEIYPMLEKQIKRTQIPTSQN